VRGGGGTLRVCVASQCASWCDLLWLLCCCCSFVFGWVSCGCSDWGGLVCRVIREARLKDEARAHIVDKERLKAEHEHELSQLQALLRKETNNTCVPLLIAVAA